jgi:SAM-dependent methyltransferase
MTDYYQTHYQEYFDRTVAVDPAGFLKPFIQRLRPGASILDIGCGSGRDLLWLGKQGFSPTGFERSSGLAELARCHSGCRVMEGDFETFDFLPFSFDAILASGSLVHVPPHRLTDVLKNIQHALAPIGVFYLSLKQGEGTFTDSLGRTFYFWRDQDIQTILLQIQMKVVFFSVSPSALNSPDLWLSYILEPL